MGVNGLWKLLSPCGRRIDIASLRYKTLAIDASIWLAQFVKAMRDPETGRMLPNAHLLGTFRRVVKLLMNRIRPVFVFDGGVPTLKRRTILARAMRREQQVEGVRRTAQRLLLNQLERQRLGEAQGSSAAAKRVGKSSARAKHTNRAASAVMHEEDQATAVGASAVSLADGFRLAQPPTKADDAAAMLAASTTTELVSGDEVQEGEGNDADDDADERDMQLAIALSLGADAKGAASADGNTQVGAAAAGLAPVSAVASDSDLVDSRGNDGHDQALALVSSGGAGLAVEAGGGAAEDDDDIAADAAEQLMDGLQTIARRSGGMGQEQGIGLPSAAEVSLRALPPHLIPEVGDRLKQELRGENRRRLLPLVTRRAD